MKNLNIVIFIWSLFGIYETNAQEVFKNSIKKDSIKKIIASSTKGMTFELSDSGINSELDEIGTSFFKNKYIVISNKKRRHYDVTFNEVKNAFNNNMYCVDVNKNGNLFFPLLFSKDLDSNLDEGSLTFTPDQNTIYFSRESETTPRTFELFKAKLDVESNRGYWFDVTKISVFENASIETPWISPDGKKIYFSSNAAGGYGGFDLYYADILENGTVGKPVNLGNAINSAEDEKYPFVSADGRHLYFSSKGHLNIGGFDVFKSSIVSENYLEPLNMGLTLNSEKDDIAFLLVEKNKGYVSNNNKAAADFDVLKFEIKEFEKTKNTFVVIEKKSGLPLPNAKVVIKDEFGKVTAEGTTNAKGEIQTVMNPVSYNFITAEKEGYEPFKATFTSEKVIDKTIALQQTKAIVTDDAIVIENIYFEFNKANLLPESELSLNKVIEVLEMFPDMRLAINAHTDSKGSQAYNQPLSEKRAKSTYDYLVKKGINPSRLTSKGYGKSQLLINCTKCSAEEDQKNRRVEFKIIKN